MPGALATGKFLAQRSGIAYMAKHGRRKFRQYLKGQIEHTLALATLASKDVIGSNVGDTVIEKAWLSSVKATHSLAFPTPLAGDGPIMVGLAHSDYTDAEIEEWIENAESWNSSDLRSQEQARRKIRRIGIFPMSETGDLTSSKVLNDGKPIRTKCGWMLDTGMTVKFWAYNMGSSALTTGRLYQVQGHVNLWPA